MLEPLLLYIEIVLLILLAEYAFGNRNNLILITTLISLLPSKRTFFDPNKRKILHGLTLVFVLNVLMVAKHYSNQYLILSFNLVIFGFLLRLSFFPFPMPLKSRVNRHVHFKTALVFHSGGLLLFSLIKGIHFSPSLINPRLKALEFVQSTVGKTQRIIVLEKSGPFIETAMFQGYAYSSGMKPKNARFLKNAYPVSYFYNIQQDVFHDWINEYNLIDILCGSPKTYFYYASAHDTIPTVLLESLHSLMTKNRITSLKTVYKDTLYKEYISEIETDSLRIAGDQIRHEPVYCNFETLAPDSNYFAMFAKDGWDSAELIVDVPEKMTGKEIAVYLWYPGKGTCYFDDLSITFFEVR